MIEHQSVLKSDRYRYPPQQNRSLNRSGEEVHDELEEQVALGKGEDEEAGDKS